MLLVIGLLLIAAGAVLLLNVGGAAGAVHRNVTSRSLGDLAPGYAATPNGMRVYAALVTTIGVVFGAVGALLQWPVYPAFGLSALGLGVLAFLVTSTIVIIGEVRTYRALKR
jgi:hypothetical protein